ncbi:HlyD family secretion protein [Hyphococcus luteus]|uniref:Efflux transporter periplasmic adaptor subunit n=1 Tax=Hyphococcus luteus TaxID=2058213 RepID=A0A2S7K2B8_9PROT|nr:HlyD family efflux transporter periplasmic adaptor subunit [Marinicaulis flavus]PQA86654.1 efflux transporter periplasmic adaptor subunit [Marinicaulis flavus]
MNLNRNSLLIGAIAIAAAAGFAAWQWSQRNGEPPGIAIANGRIEAEEIDVATKIPGRVREILVEEGDFVERDSILVRLDAAELAAALARAEAELRRAEQAVIQAEAQVNLRVSQCALATKNYERTKQLFDSGHSTAERLDIQRTEKEVAEAACQAARAELGNARELVASMTAEVQRLKAQLEETEITAPRAARVLYRLAEPGEVLPAGGRIVTLIDPTYVFMTVFLPTGEAGRLAIGAEARIVLDAVPEITIPARVSFVASRAQFTPRQVETEDERAKLMFRVKLKIDSLLLEQYKERVKTGLPGVAYIDIAGERNWPAFLEQSLIN